MGREVRCEARLGEERGEGKALLETDEVIFRGDALRFKLPLSELEDVAADGETLRLAGPQGVAVLHLGEREAARWAERIRNPPSLLDKLGISAGATVAVVGTVGDELRATVAERAALADGLDAVPAADHVLLGAEAVDDLERVPAAAERLRPGAGLWVVYPKGRKDLREADVFAAGRGAGLVDHKTARVSATHTGLRFVVPRASR